MRPDTEFVLIFLAISALAGFLGGLIASYTYQKNQRYRDKRRWEQMTVKTTPEFVPIPSGGAPMPPNKKQA